MFVLRGDSMISGFRTTRDIPVSCLEPRTVVSDKPLTSLGQAIARRVPETEICALPGIGSDVVREWFDLTPQWWGRPTLFWFGRSDRRFSPHAVIETLSYMDERLTAPWWWCAMPVTPRQKAEGKTARVDDANAMIAEFCGDRFLDPIRAMGGDGLLPEHLRLDVYHQTSVCNEQMAEWLISVTAGRFQHEAA